MLISKRKEKAEKPEETKVQDKVAKGIASFLLAVQREFASFMSGRINNLGIRSKQICLAIFCLMFGGFSIYAFYGAFQDSGNYEKTIKPGQVVVPKYYDQSDSEFKESRVSEKDRT